ncbi:MAG: DUF5597 domain-containing protein [Oscillospiraceae bacterium]|jgi:hypothetical protein|nr:DUF5597 domain-containing protein [Oscillospiraceae bacterium]
MTNSTYPDSVFQAGGAPFYPVGVQAHNNSGYSMKQLEPVWEVCRLVNANSCAIAVAWERIEPEEGRFDLEIVRQIVRACRERSLKLVLLWFGAWKNGHMKYAPQWVKMDHSRFPRVRTHDGYEIANLSSFGGETRALDKRAFCKVMEVLAQEDPQRDTILAVQVQNELGIVGRSVRDYGPEAQRQYEAPAPEGLVDRMKSAPEEEISQAWAECGRKEAGSWGELFGRRGDELLQAWSMACYVDDLAAAGKEILPVPMYTNAWLDKQGFDTPGITYPSGGAVVCNLAVWRWFAPHLDMVCPDMYMGDQRHYQMIAGAYTRRDNPLYIPETGWGVPSALGAFRAVAENGLTGVHFFGAESALQADGTLHPEAKPMAENFQCLRAVEPLLLSLRGSGRIQAAIQEEFAAEQQLHFDGWDLVARFGPYPRGGDYQHKRGEPTTERGRALIFQLGPNEFVACGVGVSLAFRKRLPLEQPRTPQMDWQHEHFMDYLLVEDGRFASDGSWTPSYLRNGDDTDFGVYLFPDNGATRILLE